MGALRGPGDYTPVHGDESHYYSDEDHNAQRHHHHHMGQRHDDRPQGVSHAEESWPADPHDPGMRFEPPPPPGPVDPWEGFTVHTAVAWGVALLCVWLGLRWMGSRHERMTGELNHADRLRAQMEEEERKKKVGGCVIHSKGESIKSIFVHAVPGGVFRLHHALFVVWRGAVQERKTETETETGGGWGEGQVAARMHLTLRRAIDQEVALGNVQVARRHFTVKAVVAVVYGSRRRQLLPQTRHIPPTPLHRRELGWQLSIEARLDVSELPALGGRDWNPPSAASAGSGVNEHVPCRVEVSTKGECRNFSNEA